MDHFNRKGSLPFVKPSLAGTEGTDVVASVKFQYGIRYLGRSLVNTSIKPSS